MTTYDWIVVGNGLAGAALSYELARQGFSVLVLEQHRQPSSATRYSYGGIPYWSGTTAITRQLCLEGIERHRILSSELDRDTQFRELDLLLTIPKGEDPAVIAPRYEKFAIPPQLVSAAAAHDLEPKLNPDAIEGALTVRHGHVHPSALTTAYNHALLQLGGTIQIAAVADLVRVGDRITGVVAEGQPYRAGKVAIANGAASRSLLKTCGIPVPLYYSHAELIETPPVDFQIRCLLMSASLKRSDLESQASRPEIDQLWDQPGHEVAPPILDAGVIQFQDNSLRMGQISRALTSLEPHVNAAQSQADLRTANSALIPALNGVPGAWSRCLVSFTRDGLPLVGPLGGIEGIHIFSGFTSPFALLPPIATRFAQWLGGKSDPIIEQMRPDRFTHQFEKSGD
ncbi:MAG: FAD-binding oxidoreductase [Leptolyngbyaceae cyanobacterium MO_188.B28]|nr:FAD-binding oxidoreductase [Leptolyngbyaceae cyanobacterium MO_188.B28]